MLSFLDPVSRDVVIADQATAVVDYFNNRLNLATEKPEAHCHWIASGESSKSVERLNAAWLDLVNANVDRNSTVIAFGGGVTGDLAGFVAATYLRGVKFVQIPTTLLAQVDSSVGGKTGINLPVAKNSAGAFWQPQAVVIDPTVLKTLEPAEFTSGLAEVVKYGVIMDVGFFEFLEANVSSIHEMDMPTMERIIQRCCELKAQVVEEDERETTGRRAILNYGHTFGHAVESVFGYGTYAHGHAVAMGMNAAANLAKLLGHVDERFVARQSRLLDALRIPCRLPADQGGAHQKMVVAMGNDKKAIRGKARFILPTRVGHVEMFADVDPELVVQAMSLASA